MAVMTNIDHEHLENYGSFGELQQAFIEFANRVPFYGSVVACADDPPLAAVLPRITRRTTTYGIASDAAHFTATDIAPGPMGISAVVRQRSQRSSDRTASPATLGRLTLQVPGRHNLLNGLAALAAASELGVTFEQAADALHQFRGAERRFDVRGEVNGVLVVDDYGHHPTEIAAVLDAARSLGRRIVVAFQPHRYTRTAALMDRFGPAFAGAGHIVLTDIYPAGEDPLPGVTIDALAAAIRGAVSAPVDVVPRLDDVVPAVVELVRANDVVITLGAGSIGSLSDRLLAALESRS
jgi:UDP-N-acetylmuramate--alanine ligase